MSDTLDSTFALFFQDHDSETCIECGSTENLQITGESNHKSVRKCQNCREQYAANLAASEAGNAALVAEHEWRNRWEE